jgi:hypothetical protein
MLSMYILKMATKKWDKNLFVTEYSPLLGRN